MQVEFNQEEVNVLMNLIDVAVKAVGLQAAESAVHFAKKFQAAVQAESDAKASQTEIKDE